MHEQLLIHVTRACLPPLADPHGTGNEAADVDLLDNDLEAADVGPEDSNAAQTGTE